MARPTVVTGSQAVAAAEVLQAQTPTQAVVKDANRIVHVTDDRGRKIGVRRMSMSIRRRLFRVITPETSAKDRLLGLYLLAACVVEINGENVDPLEAGNMSEVVFDVLVDRLDDDGFEAVTKAIADNWPTKAATKDDLKNS